MTTRIKEMTTTTNKKFTVIKGYDANYGTFYGTIKVEDIDEKGNVKKELNGIEMLIAKTLDEAMSKREDDEVIKAEIEMYMKKNNCSYGVALIQVYSKLYN